MTASSQQDVDDGPSSSRKRAVLLTGLAIAGTYAVGLAVVGIEEALDVLSRVSPGYLLGAAGMQMVVVILWSKVYGASAEAAGTRVGFWPGLQVSMPAFRSVTPSPVEAGRGTPSLRSV